MSKLAEVGWRVFVPRNVIVNRNSYYCFKYRGLSSSTSAFTSASTATSSVEIKPKICVIGAGPAGFYATQYILKRWDNAEIDIIEKLPVPFGLVRQVIFDIFLVFFFFSLTLSLLPF